LYLDLEEMNAQPKTETFSFETQEAPGARFFEGIARGRLPQMS
jgi:hypothetical protein